MTKRTEKSRETKEASGGTKCILNGGTICASWCVLKLVGSTP